MAVRDCEKIIQNDNNHIKALYIMGISKIERVKGDAIEWEEILDDGVRNIENGNFCLKANFFFEFFERNFSFSFNFG